MCEISSERVLAVERLRAGWLICASMAKDTGLPWDLQEDGPRLISVNLVLYNPMRMTPYVEIWGDSIRSTWRGQFVVDRVRNYQKPTIDQKPSVDL
ncbi:MAG: hypothetical protein ACR2OA_16665 [Rubripirellula sp.]